MSNAPRKLTLNRETLASLQRSELDGVQGGTSPAFSTIGIASMRFCLPVSAASVATAKNGFESVKKVISWVQHRPQPRALPWTVTFRH